MSCPASIDTLPVTLALGDTHPLFAGAVSHALSDITAGMDRLGWGGEQAHRESYSGNDHLHFYFLLVSFYAIQALHRCENRNTLSTNPDYFESR